MRTLTPGYFALVMATGIISIGVHENGLTRLATALLWLTAACYLVLVVMHVWRMVAFRDEVREDLRDPSRGFAFFTFVAGTDVLGTRLAQSGHTTVATALLAVGVLAWLVLGYLVPATAAVNHGGRPSVARANGTWFVWVVACQSITVLAATLQPKAATGQSGLALLAVFCWSTGVVLYGLTSALVLSRLVFYDLRPVELTPPYWVATGATAITALAGALVLGMTETALVTAVRELVIGITVVFWSFGTWLVPALVAAGWWRHVTHRVPVRYARPGGASCSRSACTASRRTRSAPPRSYPS